jgi:hypothetical protein
MDRDRTVDRSPGSRCNGSGAGAVLCVCRARRAVGSMGALSVLGRAQRGGLCRHHRGQTKAGGARPGRPRRCHPRRHPVRARRAAERSGLRDDAGDDQPSGRPGLAVARSRGRGSSGAPALADRDRLCGRHSRGPLRPASPGARRESEVPGRRADRADFRARLPRPVAPRFAPAHRRSRRTASAGSIGPARRPLRYRLCRANGCCQRGARLAARSQLIDLVEGGGLFWVFDGLCLAAERPTHIDRDRAGHLHGRAAPRSPTARAGRGGIGTAPKSSPISSSGPSASRSRRSSACQMRTGARS